MANVNDPETLIDEMIRRAEARGFYPTVFRRMRTRRGTRKAIERAVRSGDTRPGNALPGVSLRTVCSLSRRSHSEVTRQPQPERIMKGITAVMSFVKR